MIAAVAAACLVFVAPAAAGHGLPALHAEPNRDTGGVIVDARGRQVQLRGVAENSLGDYWQGNDFPTVFPLEPRDPQLMASRGWNVVRIVLNWSRVEPAPGVYDEAYIAEVAARVRRFARAGLYSIIDFHQDAWSATLAARPGELCLPGSEPGIGWDGAPAWATLDDGRPRCTFSSREANPAVDAAWNAFWDDRPAGDGVGVQTRFVAMWRHVAQRLARVQGLAAFELLNEPVAVSASQSAAMSRLYERLFAAIRDGEREARAPAHIVMFEPSILWDITSSGAPPPFAHDGNAAYAPHLYSGVFTPGSPHAPQRQHFRNAADEARDLGGLPVVSTEWGGRRSTTAEQGDPYFVEHQALQDEFGFSAVLWVWRFSCGDPHAVEQMRHNKPVDIRGPFTVDCATNRVTGRKETLWRQLAWPYPRAIAGRSVTHSFDIAGGRFALDYQVSGRAVSEVAVPRDAYPTGYSAVVDGARVLSAADAPLLRLRAEPGTRSVSLRIAPRPAGTAPLTCRDGKPPRAALVRARSRSARRGLTLRGRASDRGCLGGADRAARPGAVKSVAVAVWLADGRRCRHLRAGGTLQRPSSCRARRYLRVRGTKRWTLTTRRRLRPGRYRVAAMVTDVAGNTSRRVLGSVRVR